MSPALCMHDLAHDVSEATVTQLAEEHRRCSRVVHALLYVFQACSTQSPTMSDFLLVLYSYRRSTLQSWWLGSQVVSMLDSGTLRPGFKLQLRRCLVTVLGKLFTPIMPLFTNQQNW